MGFKDCKIIKSITTHSKNVKSAKGNIFFKGSCRSRKYGYTGTCFVIGNFMNKKYDEDIPIKDQTQNRPITRRIHVLEVIGNSYQGGMENYLKSFIKNLPLSQFKITCICPNESSFTAELRKLGVEQVYITPVEDDPRWRSIQLVVEVARLHNIDILHAHMPKAHVLAGIAGALIHKPVVATVHGMNMSTQELGIYRAFRSFLTTNCTEAYTQALAMGVSSNHVTLIRNGVEIPKEAMIQHHKLREFLGLSRQTSLVGFVGRLDHEKGPDIFLRVAEYLHHKMPEVHFVIVGDGAMREELEDFVKCHHLSANVHFTGWWSEAGEIYPSIDVLAHTSRSDGTSLVLLEGMSYGCPAVAMAVGGIREIIENGTTGMLLGSDDWVGVALGILHLLEKPLVRQSMSVASRKRVQELFNVKTNTALTAEVLLKRVFSSESNQSAFAGNLKKSPLKPALKPPLKPNGSN